MKKKLLIAFCTFAILGVSTPTYAGGVTGVEVQKDDSEKYGTISDFDYTSIFWDAVIVFESFTVSPHFITLIY